MLHFFLLAQAYAQCPQGNTSFNWDIHGTAIKNQFHSHFSLFVFSHLVSLCLFICLEGQSPKAGGAEMQAAFKDFTFTSSLSKVRKKRDRREAKKAALK